MATFSEQYDAYHVFKETYKDPSPELYEDHMKDVELSNELAAFWDWVQHVYPDILVEYARSTTDDYDDRPVLGTI